MNIGLRPSVNSLKSETGCQVGDKCLFLHYKVDEQPNKKSKTSYFQKRHSDDKNALAIVKSESQLGCVIQDSDALVAQGTKEFRGNPTQKVLEPISKSSNIKSTLRHASILDKKGPSLGKNVKVLYQRSPWAIIFDDRSHEETERQERCAQIKVWDLAKIKFKFKENDKTTFFSLAEEWVGAFYLGQRPGQKFGG